jgi:probable HAF family extracellular repeat protein
MILKRGIMTWLRKGLRPAVARTAGHFLLLTGILTGTALPALALPMFEATDLGLLPGGGGDSYAYDINERGQVVGFSSTSMTDYHGRAFLWDPVMGMEDLGDLSGGNYSYAYGINNKGQVVGTSFSTSHALLWQADGQMVDLGALIDPTGGKSSAAAINDRGQVVGTAAITGGGYLWDPVAGVTPLGFTPTSINSTGEVGGYIQDSSAVRQAVLWDAVNGLRVLDPSRGYVSDLNDSGEAAGIGGTGENPYFLWGADGKGVPVEPILPGRVMEGWSLNNKGQVVGSVFFDS